MSRRKQKEGGVQPRRKKQKENGMTFRVLKILAICLLVAFAALAVLMAVSPSFFAFPAAELPIFYWSDYRRFLWF